MKALLLDALFYSLMVGAGESYLAAYSLSLGHCEIATAILISIPMIIGGFAQTLAPYLINKIKAYRPIVLWGVFFQALTLLAIAILHPMMSKNYSFLFALVTLYWIMALGITPAWNSWISGLLPADKIRPFFAQRNLMIGLGTMLGLITTGLLLQFGANIVPINLFQAVFISCFIFRIISLFTLIKHPRVHFKRVEIDSSEEDIPQKKQNPFIMSFIRYSSLFKLGVYFSASFFAPFMLKKLHFTYIEFMMILLASFLGRIFVSQFLRNKLIRFDVNRIYLLASIGISIIPILWSFNKNPAIIFSFEILTGILWGMFEISFLVTIFEEIPMEYQSHYMSKYNFMHTLAIGIGSLLGLSYFYFFKDYQYVYQTIFLISATLRFFFILWFPKKETRTKRKSIPPLFRFLAVRPNIGVMGRPIWQLFNKIKKK